jgi:Zn-dependent oligopeptidase
MYASFGHLTGYSSNYYTYMFDKVIALDFFGQFDKKDCTGLRGRRALSQNGARTGRVEAGASRWCAIFWDATKSSPHSASG